MIPFFIRNGLLIDEGMLGESNPGSLNSIRGSLVLMMVFESINFRGFPKKEHLIGLMGRVVLTGIGGLITLNNELFFKCILPGL
jgi:hypothetical protein